MSASDQRKQMEESLKQVKVNQETFEECQKSMARFYYSRYRFLIEAGFTEAQAFEIVKHRGVE